MSTATPYPIFFPLPVYSLKDDDVLWVEFCPHGFAMACATDDKKHTLKNPVAKTVRWYKERGGLDYNHAGQCEEEA